jgi:L-alanine-DL-glutamate epimerase-like enolase superfamily enzyme
MKITGLETFLLKIPFSGAAEAEIAAGAADAMNVLLLRIDTEDGPSGWGEAFGHGISPATRTALETLIAPRLIGRDAGDITGIFRDLQQATHVLGRTGAARYAVSGVDIALWDIAGKVAGLPLYRLLGGPAREEVEAYASLLRYGEAKKLIRICKAALAEGYRAIKLHEIKPELMLAARAAVGPEVALMVDCNCPCSVAQAVEVARQVTPAALGWLEEPVWPPEDHRGLARVRAAGVKVAAGENVASLHEFREFFLSGALDVAQPSVAKIGLTEARDVLALARAHDVTVAPHCAYFGAGYLAALHLVASMPERPLFERMYLDLEASPFSPFTETRGPMVALPQKPGLGCDPDPEVMARYRVAL